jgi:hypothetical protein
VRSDSGVLLCVLTRLTSGMCNVQLVYLVSRNLTHVITIPLIEVRLYIGIYTSGTRRKKRIKYSRTSDRIQQAIEP